LPTNITKLECDRLRYPEARLPQQPEEQAIPLVLRGIDETVGLLRCVR